MRISDWSSDVRSSDLCVTPAGNKLVWRRMLLQRHFDLLQLLPETRFYRTRMQAQHGKTVLRVLSAKRQHGRYGIRVNIGKKYPFNSLTEGMFHRYLPVLIEFREIEMSMRIRQQIIFRV